MDTVKKLMSGTLEKAYQNKIKQSPMWDMMVKEYGKAEAEKLLLQCKVKID